MSENILDRVKLLMKYNLNETYNENKKRILSEEEVDVSTMEKYVDTAVDDLDGLVNMKNLKSLFDILTELKGKTYRGKNAISEFLRLYTADENGDLFVNDVNSVGTKTLGAQAQDYKDDILALAGAPTTGTKTGTDTGTKTGTDTGTKTGTDTGTKTGTDKAKSSFTPCQKGKYVKGCKDPKVKEVQVCLGMQAKHQTGNFGPITQGELQKLGKGFENGFTDNDVQTICNLAKNKGGGDFYDVDTPGGNTDVVDIDKLP